MSMRCVCVDAMSCDVSADVSVVLCPCLHVLMHVQPPAYGGYGGYEAPYGGYAPAPRGRFHNKRGTFAPY